jgi:hypothetical protein
MLHPSGRQHLQAPRLIYSSSTVKDVSVEAHRSGEAEGTYESHLLVLRDTPTLEEALPDFIDRQHKLTL